ncbi:MAG: hypothetical protein KAS32_18485 [Candidatus Peribacteraceae bacterium]|nr:hypothetical protein [Candidatus Peribacteraceae bacterium]
MRSIYLFIIGILIGFGIPISIQASSFNADECSAEIYSMIEKEHRTFRSAIFGHKLAEDAPIGSVDYSNNGLPWYKDDLNSWRSDNENEAPLTNEDMNNNSEALVVFGHPRRKGILETKRMTTSELLPYIGNSLRAFQCRLANICETLSLSKTQTSDFPIPLTVKTPSCLAIEIPSISSCHINAYGTIGDDIALFNNCENAMQQILDQEAALLTAVVRYDSAYRSLLQIAGNIDLFLESFSSPVNTTLNNVTNIVTSFSRIPCFLSSCDGSPPSH